MVYIQGVSGVLKETELDSRENVMQCLLVHNTFARQPCHYIRH